ncbi:GDSL esterase/lipase 6 [Heracleum sosnowskyi]|uniref:GDSL esterase/lipase 6 n=1 Tax=Heracleum sosnowskyi TaxID=360622 RepID=A0AAD8M306_9APIA|nr:GDSL esterase/lipase 6 [Heracleum sosnowskyi]
MGNYVSCTLSSPLRGKKQSRATKVIFPTGEIRQFYDPVKAAELMLECPNSFLVNSKALQIGRRFSALHADQDLEMATVYVLFPMKRLNSFVTSADMGTLFLTAKRVSIGNARILPETSVPTVEHNQEAFPKLNLDDIEEFSVPEYSQRLSLCRSKKPVLETIAEEEPVGLR